MRNASAAKGLCEKYSPHVDKFMTQGNLTINEYVREAMTFGEYIALIDKLLAEGKTTGPTQSEAMLRYAKLNRQRMKRLDKTVEITPDLSAAMRSITSRFVWLIITEGWCGDAAQNIPVIEKIAAENRGVSTRYLLRDENTELIDRFLTKGARAIPKLIVIDTLTSSVAGSWGARPHAAQELFNELRARGTPGFLVMENLQRWYNADRTRSIQAEFLESIALWDAAAAGVRAWQERHKNIDVPAPAASGRRTD